VICLNKTVKTAAVCSNSSFFVQPCIADTFSAAIAAGNIILR